MIKLTPQKPPYYENVQAVKNLIQTKSTLTTVPTAETATYDTFTIPKNTINKTGYGIQIELWVNVVTLANNPRVLINWNGVNIQAPSLAATGLNKIVYTIMWQATDKASTMLEGYSGTTLIRQFNTATGRDWTIDNDIEIQLSSAAGDEQQAIAIVTKTISPTQN